MAIKMAFQDGEPICPAVGCGSKKFDTTFELVGPGDWKIESLYCHKCNTEIEVTEELDRWVRGEKWTVKTE